MFALVCGGGGGPRMGEGWEKMPRRDAQDDGQSEFG